MDDFPELKGHLYPLLDLITLLKAEQTEKSAEDIALILLNLLREFNRGKFELWMIAAAAERLSVTPDNDEMPQGASIAKSYDGVDIPQPRS